MKLRNRILSAVMAIAACMTFVGTSAFATDGYAWTFTSSAEGKIAAGTEFTVTLDITENAGLIGMNAEVSYDAEGLELLSAPTITSILGTDSSNKVVANPFVISVGDGLDPVMTTGNLATFNFKAIKDGSWDIELVNPAETAMDGNFEFVEFAAKTITIEVGADEAKVEVLEKKNNKADKAEGEAYTQGFKLQVPVVDGATLVGEFTKDAGKTYTEAKPIFTAFDKFSGEASFVLGLNVKNVPYNETVDGQFGLAK